MKVSDSEKLFKIKKCYFILLLLFFKVECYIYRCVEFFFYHNYLLLALVIILPLLKKVNLKQSRTLTRLSDVRQRNIKKKKQLRSTWASEDYIFFVIAVRNNMRDFMEIFPI